MLTSDTITVIFESADAWSVSSSILQMYAFLLSLLFLFVEWKEKQLGNISIILSPGENLVLKRLKKGKTLFNLLFASTIGHLIFNCCLIVNLLSDKWWLLLLFKCLNSNNDLMMWFDNSACVLSWNLLLSFCRCKWIGIRPMMASISREGEVQKASNTIMENYIV